MIKIDEDAAVKKPHMKDDYGAGGSTEGERKAKELFMCMQDPLYFMRNFIKARHPIRGSVPFNPYPYQANMVKSFQKHKNTIILAGRQLGKSSTYKTSIKINDLENEIGSLLPLTFKENVIKLLENILLRLAINI